MNATSLPRIYADERGLKHRDLTEKLIRIFFDIYNELGHGFLESVYQKALTLALKQNSGVLLSKTKEKSAFIRVDPRRGICFETGDTIHLD